ncbi:MAG: hypothetical protein NZ483_07480 [Verrucomicrobiae bacterium]|nr:hypothetical protein [Verrucomicrobiae bacterium]MDW8343902.1 hypothetical protein [Verrucomicrobiae bacterium]
MKRNGTKSARNERLTLGDVICTVQSLTRNSRLSAWIVADLINRGHVRLEGRYHGRRVVVV